MTAQFPALGFKFEREYYYLRVIKTNSTIKYTIQSRQTKYISREFNRLY